MQNLKKYKICELEDKSKRIMIINFYDNSIIYHGSYEEVPRIFVDMEMRIFTPYEDHYEFYVWGIKYV